MQIRPVTAADHAEVISLLHHGLSPYQPNAIQLPAIWRDFSAQAGVHAVVAASDRRIVGFGVVLVELKIRGGRMGHIEDIVVASEARKSGIGRAIMAELCAIAASQGCYKISLACADRNIDFYRKCGFGVDGVSMSRLLA